MDVADQLTRIFYEIDNFCKTFNSKLGLTTTPRFMP